MELDGSTPLTIPPAALVPLIILTVGFLVYCWVDIARHPVKLLPKWLWAIICAASVPVGGIIYLILGRDEARES